MTQTSHDQQTEPPHPTHEDVEADTHRKQWIRYSAVAAAITLGVVLLFKFVINPLVLDYFMAHPQTKAEIQHENLLNKYDIASLETSTKSAGRGYGGLPTSVTYYVVDGVMRDCKITGSTEDPILTCVGWEPPLRSATPAPGGLGSSDPTTNEPTPEVSVTETTFP